MIIKVITKTIRQENIEYAIYFFDGKCLIINGNSECQGISYWGEYYGMNDLDIESGSILGGAIINYSELPEIVKSHIEWLLNNEYQCRHNIAHIISCKIVQLLKKENLSSDLVAKRLSVDVHEMLDVYVGDCVFKWEQLQVIENEFGIPCSTVIADEYNRANVLYAKVSNIHKAIANKYKPHS